LAFGNPNSTPFNTISYLLSFFLTHRERELDFFEKTSIDEVFIGSKYVPLQSPCSVMDFVLPTRFQRVVDASNKDPSTTQVN